MQSHEASLLCCAYVLSGNEEIGSFSVIVWNCCWWAPGRRDCPVASSRPSDQRQRRPDDRKCWAGNVVRSGDVEWLTGWECWRLVYSSWPGTPELCSADSDALWLPVCSGLRWHYRIRPKISSNSNEFNVVLPVLLKKIIVVQLLSLVCSTNLVGCPCPNVANTLVWRFSTRRSINTLVWRFSTRRSITFRPFLWITFQFHHGIMKINLCHCQFVLMLFKYSFFPRTVTDWNSLPLAVRLSQSIQSFHGGLLSSASSYHCWS